MVIETSGRTKHKQPRGESGLTHICEDRPDSPRVFCHLASTPALTLSAASTALARGVLGIPLSVRPGRQVSR